VRRKDITYDQAEWFGAQVCRCVDWMGTPCHNRVHQLLIAYELTSNAVYTSAKFDVELELAPKKYNQYGAHRNPTTGFTVLGTMCSHTGTLGLAALAKEQSRRCAGRIPVVHLERFARFRCLGWIARGVVDRL
jgi:hypothetical protein